MAPNSRLSALFQASIWLLAAPVAEGAISAWWTDNGPSLVMQRSTSNDIYYSNCNSNKQPTLPEDGSIVLPVSKTPKNNTGLAGTGWLDGGGFTVLSLFYQDTSDEIVNALYHCDMTSGTYMAQGAWVISAGAPSANPKTALAAVLLGQTGGYRVYYYDNDMNIHQLGYTSTTGWGYYDAVSHDPQYSQVIAAAFSGSGNISVVSPRDSSNIKVSRLYTDQSWHITTFPTPLDGNLTTNSTNATSFALNDTVAAPFTLPAWSGTPNGMGISVDNTNARSVFYIGSDSKLYEVAYQNSTWGLQDNQTADVWPVADDANAGLAVTYNPPTNDIRVYYTSGGNITEVKYSGSTWSKASALPTVNAAASSTSSSNTSTSSSAGDSGLSTGAKAGIGVGVSLGAIAFFAILGAFFFLRSRQRKKDREAAAGAASQFGGSQPHTPGPAHSYAGTDPAGSPYYKPEEKYGQPVYGHQQQHLGELDAQRQVHEMENPVYSHELMSEGHYRELPGDAVFTPQTPSQHQAATTGTYQEQPHIQR